MRAARPLPAREADGCSRSARRHAITPIRGRDTGVSRETGEDERGGLRLPAAQLLRVELEVGARADLIRFRFAPGDASLTVTDSVVAGEEIAR